MTVTSTTNNSLEQISNSYQSSGTKKAKKEDALGRDAFLSMLVAQLQNQDPLNPMDGTDFSAQLAQFSQLEQLINLNDSMDNLASASEQKSGGDVMSYLGKQVTGNVNLMNVDEGTVSGGFYNLSRTADVMITITDADGNTVKTLYEGQQDGGSHLISWDGTNNAGDAVEDGSYQYTVLANSGSGYAQVPSSISGTVDGVAYNNGKAYLVVQGVLLDPDSLTAVMNAQDQTAGSDGGSALTYLGKTVSANTSIVLVEDGGVAGTELGFKLDKSEDATVNIYDAYDELVRTISLSSDDTAGGKNSLEWNGISDSGNMVPDGMYYYTVKTASGFADVGVKEEVSGIKYLNGSQYLVLNDSGRLVAMSTITGVN